MKRLLLPAWILLALEVGFVILLAVTRNVGDDAAGRGMATGFAIVLAPIVLLTAGLLFWGSRGGPAPALWVGVLLAFAPVLFFGMNFAGSTLSTIDHALGRAQFGKFDDRRMTSLARAIERMDTSTVASMLREGRIDWAARDRMGQTILGHAIRRAVDEYEDPRPVIPVRMLVDAGAPVIATAIAPARSQRSVSEHDLVFHLFAVHNANALAILDLVLSHGLSANGVDEDGRPMYMSTYTTLPALQVLAKHGADFTRLDTRTDRPGWTGLMLWSAMTEWGIASFFLAHGVSPLHVARDGATLKTVLAESDPPDAKYYGPDEAAHAAFLAALSAVPGWK